MKKDLKIIPVVSFFNADQNKSYIYNENRNKSGIYRQLILKNNKSYIGSAVNLSKRFSNYFSLNGIKNELSRNISHIYSAILKYNFINFRLDILEYCDKDQILNREQYYINLLNPEYNILKTAGSRFGPEVAFSTRKKISGALRKNKSLNKDKSENKLVKNNESKVVTLNSNLKLFSGYNYINVKVFDSSNTLVKQFTDIKSAAKSLNLSVRTLYKIRDTGISYDDFIYKFEGKDIRI